MKDEEILKDRESQYGCPKEFFKTYGEMCRLLDAYAETSDEESICEGRLVALKLALLKIVRAAWNPTLTDSYQDARNYITIAEMMPTNQNKSK